MCFVWFRGQCQYRVKLWFCLSLVTCAYIAINNLQVLEEKPSACSYELHHGCLDCSFLSFHSHRFSWSCEKDDSLRQASLPCKNHNLLISPSFALLSFLISCFPCPFFVFWKNINLFVWLFSKLVFDWKILWKRKPREHQMCFSNDYLNPFQLKDQ